MQNMFEKIYIHYGCKKFDRNEFEPIRNVPYITKPYGGLWASSVDAEYGWKDWCTGEGFRECLEDDSFRFILPGANILYISSKNDLDGLPIINKYSGSTTLDFEKLLNLGYDAVEVNISSDRDLYMLLYGWDCDSIIVMNPDKIVLI